MQARMRNPATIVPDAMQALLAVGAAAGKCGLPRNVALLAHLRASQINGCSFCADMHARELKQAGEIDERLWSISAWREAPYFSEAERAALALTEAATRLSDRMDAVPDEIWNEAVRHFAEPALAALILNIGLINLWNRLNVCVRQVAGTGPR